MNPCLMPKFLFGMTVVFFGDITWLWEYFVRWICLISLTTHRNVPSHLLLGHTLVPEWVALYMLRPVWLSQCFVHYTTSRNAEIYLWSVHWIFDALVTFTFQILLTDFSKESNETIRPMSLAVRHLEWEFVNFIGTVDTKRHSTNSYPTVTYKLTLRRRNGYLNYVFVVPASVMALLVPVLFLLQPGSGEKITLGEEL